MKDIIKHELEESSRVKKLLADSMSDKITEAAQAIYDSIKKGGKVILFGNGGSAADAQHIAADLVGRYKLDKGGLPAMALTTDTSVMTAIANDYGFDKIFSKQIEAMASKNDVIIAISTSGNSSNVIEGIQAAKKMGIKTIGLTGQDGGELTKAVDISINVPSKDTPRIQEAHIAIGHIFCYVAEMKTFWGEET